MGSHWLTTHVCSAERVSELLRTPELLERVVEKHRSYVARIAKGDCPRDEKTLTHPEGDRFIAALFSVTELGSLATATFDCYDDEDETPELWSFIWSEWEPRDFFSLPLAASGAPSVTFKDAAACSRHAVQFRAVQARGGYGEFMSSQSLSALIAALETAISTGLGLFAYYEL